jgi:hypothetical protein
MFDTAYLDKNVKKNCRCKKIAQNVAFSLGSFIFSRNHSDLPEVAQFGKNCPIWT